MWISVFILIKDVGVIQALGIDGLEYLDTFIQALGIDGLEYLDNFIQALGIFWNFLNEVIHANQSILFIYNHNSYKH